MKLAVAFLLVALATIATASDGDLVPKTKLTEHSRGAFTATLFLAIKKSDTIMSKSDATPEQKRHWLQCFMRSYVFTLKIIAKHYAVDIKTLLGNLIKDVDITLDLGHAIKDDDFSKFVDKHWEKFVASLHDIMNKTLVLTIKLVKIEDEWNTLLTPLGVSFKSLKYIVLWGKYIPSLCIPGVCTPPLP